MLLLEVITRNTILYNQMKWFLQYEMRLFYDCSPLGEFVISFWIDGCYFRIIIRWNRQFDGNYGTIANHELHKRVCRKFVKMTQRGGTISIESLRIRQLPALHFIPLFQRSAWYTVCHIQSSILFTHTKVMYAETYCK